MGKKPYKLNLLWWAPKMPPSVYHVGSEWNWGIIM